MIFITVEITSRRSDREQSQSNSVTFLILIPFLVILYSVNVVIFNLVLIGDLLVVVTFKGLADCTQLGNEIGLNQSFNGVCTSLWYL